MQRSQSIPTNVRIGSFPNSASPSKFPPSALSQTLPSTTRRRPYSAYTKLHNHVTSIDSPVSNREQWWRIGVQETPVSTRYQISDFVEEIGTRTDTYHFRDVGRDKPIASTQTNGSLLLPGAYNKSRYPDDFLTANRFSYNFRGVERDRVQKIGHGYGDKDVEIPPNKYDVVKYTPNLGNKDSVFKSNIRREPFKGKEGPAPCQYFNSLKSSLLSNNYMFKSKVPRLVPSSTKVPGPGSYNPKDII